MALPNGSCKLHGGMSTDPETLEGRQAIGAATKARMSNGQLQKPQDGFQTWLEPVADSTHRGWLHETYRRLKMVSTSISN